MGQWPFVLPGLWDAMEQVSDRALRCFLEARHRAGAQAVPAAHFPFAVYLF